MGNTVQLTKNGQPVFPVTDVSLVMGLNEGALQEAKIAWDGESTPVVADIPAGVTVTYNSTTYTGTLVASEDSVGQEYWVSDGNGGYDRYMANATSGTYQWKNIGNTDIDLTTYAKQADLNQLDQQLNGEVVETDVPIDYATASGFNGFINASNKWESTTNYPCALISISPGTKLKIVTGTKNCDIAILKTDTHTAGTTPDFSASYVGRIVGSELPGNLIIPEDAHYLYVRKKGSNGVYDTVIYQVEESRTEGIIERLGVVEDESESQQEDIDELQLSLDTIIPNLTWENKSINTANGAIAASTTRLLCSSILTRGQWKMTVGSGFVIRSINYFSLSGSWVSSDFIGEQEAVSKSLAAGRMIRVAICKEDATQNISPADSFNFNIVQYQVSPDILVAGTFNSSYNEENTEGIRESFSALIDGKGKIETFLLFSDPHLTPESRYETMTELVRDRYISALQKYYNSLPEDMCICLGDWLNSAHTTKEACGWLGYCDAYMRKLFRNYLPVLGNHDNNPYNPNFLNESWNNALTYKTCENLMFRENKGTYYSFDGNNTKFYVLNSGVSFIKTMTNSTYSRLVDNRWDQVGWFGAKLLSDDPENGAVLMHIYSNAGNEEEWFSEETGYRAAGIHELAANIKAMALAYNKRHSITLNGETYDFGNCEGNIAFILCGHTHFDYVDTSEELPIVCCTNLEGGYLDGDSVSYTLTPTFDNCVVDYDNGVIYMVRVGAAKSRIIHFATKSVQSGNTLSLTTELSGAVTWTSRDSVIATVSNGTVTGVSSGAVGVIASNDTTEEYWIIKVS